MKMTNSELHSLSLKCAFSSYGGYQAPTKSVGHTAEYSRRKRLDEVNKQQHVDEQIAKARRQNLNLSDPKVYQESVTAPAERLVGLSQQPHHKVKSFWTNPFDHVASRISNWHGENQRYDDIETRQGLTQRLIDKGGDKYNLDHRTHLVNIPANSASAASMNTLGDVYGIGKEVVQDTAAAAAMSTATGLTATPLAAAKLLWKAPKYVSRGLSLARVLNKGNKMRRFGRGLDYTGRIGSKVYDKMDDVERWGSRGMDWVNKTKAVTKGTQLLNTNRLTKGIGTFASAGGEIIAEDLLADATGRHVPLRGVNILDGSSLNKVRSIAQRFGKGSLREGLEGSTKAILKTAPRTAFQIAGDTIPKAGLVETGYIPGVSADKAGLSSLNAGLKSLNMPTSSVGVPATAAAGNWMDNLKNINLSDSNKQALMLAAILGGGYMMAS